MRQHERQRLDDVRRLPQHHLALGERLADQPELVVLEVAQAAVDQLGAPLRRGRGEVVLLDQQHLEPAAGGVARDARAVDAGADDEEIELRGGGRTWRDLVRACAPILAQRPRGSGARRAHCANIALRPSGMPRGPMNLVPEVAALVPEHARPGATTSTRTPRPRSRRRRPARSSPTSCARSGSRCTPGSRRPASSACCAAAPASDAIGLRADLDALHIHEKIRRRARVDRSRARCTPAATTATRRCCSARRRRSRSEAQLRRHRLFHLPARRGERGRRPRDGRGGPVRAVPDARRLRHAQLAAACRSARSRCARAR